MSRAPLYDSTVAISLYNLLCLAPDGLNIEELYQRAVKAQHPHLDKAQTLRALDGLGERKLVERTGDGYRVVDPKFRPVAGRSNNEDPRTLDLLTSGWTGWRFRDGQQVLPFNAQEGKTP
jgi:hypothetical protein